MKVKTNNTEYTYDYKQLRVREKTKKKLKEVAKEKGMSLMDVVDELLSAA